MCDLSQLFNSSVLPRENSYSMLMNSNTDNKNFKIEFGLILKDVSVLHICESGSALYLDSK